MKRHKLLSVIALTAMLTQVNNINAQAKWRLGGNSLCPGGDCLDGTNNSLGTDATANLPLNIMTNGIQRMHINQNTGLTDGFIGMGNGFNNPQSHLHINNLTNQETWLQITHNQTGATNTDGLRLGIINTTGGLQPSTAFLRWHENSPFIIQTGGSTINGSTINGGERIRISAIGAPTDNPDPFNVQGNETRIGISHNSLSIGTTSTPITRIRSLLHLGYNVGEIAGNINLNEGWRSWMDLGTFTGNGRENMYIGFKQEITGGVIGILPEDSHYEAIINWGDNEIAALGERNTNLRFIYTTPQIGTVNTPQSQVDGLETMRIEPTVATTLAAPNFGMVGIGNFSLTGPNTANPDVVNAKLDIDGDLRIRTVTQDNTLTQILAIDPTDHNRVHWIDGSNLDGGVGNYCSVPQNALTSDYEIALDNANYYFSKQGDFTNAVGIGLPCGTPISFARLHVLQTSRNPLFNPGVNIAGQFNNTAGGSYSVGVYADAVTTGANNIGGYFNASGGSQNNFGIYCTAPVVPATSGNYPSNLALFADGDSYVSGIPFITQNAQVVSDQLFKTNIQPINNALSLINQLQPRTYNYDATSRIHFQSGIQYGLIAQEVEPILPNLVMESVIPAEFDSLGNIINPAIPYKSLNYNAFFAILMKGMQEQQSSIDSLKAINNNLETRLTYLENCIRNANICETGNRTINNEPSNNSNSRSIELVNTNSIILDQNLPNPFAENTVINYNIPTDVMEAKLMFYDLNGRIIKELIIEERGESKLTVYGANLKTGIYTYSLIADGELIATKKMVKK